MSLPRNLVSSFTLFHSSNTFKRQSTVLSFRPLLTSSTNLASKLPRVGDLDRGFLQAPVLESKLGSTVARRFTV